MSNNSSQSPLKALLQGTAVLTISNITLKAINFFLLPLYTAYLTPEMLGINDAIVNFTSLLHTLLVLALDSAFSAFYYDRQEEEYQLCVLSTVWFTLFLTSMLAIAMCLLSSQISNLLFGSSAYSFAIRLSLISIVLNLWWLPFSLDLRMRNKMGLYAIGTISASISMVLLNILFVVVFEMGYYSLILSSILVNALELFLFILLCKKKPRFKFVKKRLLANMLRYSLPLMPSAFAYWVIQLASTYIIMAYGSTTDVGVFGVAARCSTAVNMISSAFFMSYTAYAFQKANTDPDAPNSFARILSVFFLLFAILCLSISLLGKEIISIMASEDYQAASYILPGLLFGQMFYGLSQITGYGLSIKKKPVYITISVGIAAGISFAGNLLVIPYYGAVGASYVTTCAYIVLFILTTFFAQRQYPCPYDLKRVASGSIAAIAIYLTCLNLPLATRLLAILAGTIFLVLLFKKDFVLAKDVLFNLMRPRLKK